MPQLTWDPVHFLSVLGVAPEIGEYKTWHRYIVTQPPVRLQITLWLQRTVTRRRGDSASAPFHYALAPRLTRQRAAAELQR
jgi:hypothetical protein